MHKLVGPEWLGEVASDDPADPRPFLLPGVRVEFGPVGHKAVRLGREAARAVLAEDETDIVGAGEALSAVLIRHGIRRWEGVGDLGGTPVEPTPETIALFVDGPRAFEAADRVYVGAWAKRDMEGNASAGSPDGTGAEAMPAKDIARSPARPSRKAAAGRTRKPAPKGAPTSSTNRPATKAKPSGM